MVDIIELIGKIKGYEDIPLRIQEIYFANVQFKIIKHDDHPAAQPYMGMVSNGQ